MLRNRSIYVNKNCQNLEYYAEYSPISDTEAGLNEIDESKVYTQKAEHPMEGGVL